MLAILLLQAVMAQVPKTIDLLTERACVSEGDDVIVCARRPGEQRLRPLSSPIAASGPPDGPLSVRLPGGGSARFEAIQTQLPGASGQGAAVTVKIPF